MKKTYATLVKYRYIILVVLSLLIAGQMTQPHLDLFPIEFEWLSTSLLFLTTVALMAIAGLIGYAAPLSSRVLHAAYPILAILLLVTFAIFALTFLEMYRLIVGSTLPSEYWRLSMSILGAAISAWVVLAAVIGSITSESRAGVRYSTLVVLPLILAGCIGMALMATIGPYLYEAGVPLLLSGLAVPLMIGAILLHRTPADVPRTRRLYLVTAMKAVGASVIILALLSSVLIALRSPWYFIIWVPLSSAGIAFLLTMFIATFEHPGRNVAMTVVGLWALIVFMGWYWVGTMGNGLEGLEEAQRAIADQAVYEADCESRIQPQYRVINLDGRPTVKLRTWWRLPANCDAMPRWIE